MACVHCLLWWLLGQERVLSWARRAINDHGYEAKGARRLYMYSKEDAVVGWEEVERHAAEARAGGWAAKTELFGGSPHGGHARRSPGRYWTAVRRAWDRADEAEQCAAATRLAALGMQPLRP